MKKLCLAIGLVLVANVAWARTYSEYNVAGQVDIEPGAVAWGTNVHNNLSDCSDGFTCATTVNSLEQLGTPGGTPVIAFGSALDSMVCFEVDFPLAAAPGQESNWECDIEWSINRTSLDADRRACFACSAQFYESNANYVDHTGGTGAYATQSCAPAGGQVQMHTGECVAPNLIAFGVQENGPCDRTGVDPCKGRHGFLCVRRQVAGCANNANTRAYLEKVHMVFPIQ